jgi:hypothetical protein
VNRKVNRKVNRVEILRRVYDVSKIHLSPFLTDWGLDYIWSFDTLRAPDNPLALPFLVLKYILALCFIRKFPL